MKKTLSLLFLSSLIIIIAALSACGEGSGTPTQTEVAQTGDATIKTPDTEPETVREPETEPETEKVAKVILLAGQSNAAGSTFRNYLETRFTEEYSRERLAKADAGYQNVLIRYSVNPLDPEQGPKNENEDFEPVTFGTGNKSEDYDPEWGPSFGPEIGIAEYLSETYPDETFYIIKCATSGTSMNSRWNPDGLSEERNLTAHLLSFVESALVSLEDRGLKPEIVTFCWMQGETDAAMKYDYSDYIDQFNKLIDMVAALGRVPEEGMTVADAGIVLYRPYAKKINELKKANADTSDFRFFIDTTDLDIKRYSDEFAGHFQCYPMIVLGRRFGACVAASLEHRQPEWPAFPG